MKQASQTIAVAWTWRHHGGLYRATVHLQGRDDKTLCGYSYGSHWFFDISYDLTAFTCLRCKKVQDAPPAVATSLMETKMAKNSTQPSPKTYHVIANIDGGWSVRKTSAKRAVKRFNTQEEAVVFGKKLITSQCAELFIHSKDGRVQEKLPANQT